MAADTLTSACRSRIRVDEISVFMKSGGVSSGLSVVRDLREARRPASAEELADYETDLLAGFALAPASAGCRTCGPGSLPPYAPPCPPQA
jgi:hypothetical protein